MCKKSAATHSKSHIFPMPNYKIESTSELALFALHHLQFWQAVKASLSKPTRGPSLCGSQSPSCEEQKAKGQKQQGPPSSPKLHY